MQVSRCQSLIILLWLRNAWRAEVKTLLTIYDVSFQQTLDNVCRSSPKLRPPLLFRGREGHCRREEEKVGRKEGRKEVEGWEWDGLHSLVARPKVRTKRKGKKIGTVARRKYNSRPATDRPLPRPGGRRAGQPAPSPSCPFCLNEV